MGRRTAALIAALIAAMTLFAVSASKASGASTYQVYECQGNDLSRAAPDVEQTAGQGDPAVWYAANCDAPLNGSGWYKGVLFRPPYSGSFYGWRLGQARLLAPPTTYFSSGSFLADFGAFWGACTNSSSCWRTQVNVGKTDGSIIWPFYSATDTPHTQWVTWGSCFIDCTQIWMSFYCNAGALCAHNASPDDWYYDYVAMRWFDLHLTDVEDPTLAIRGSIFDGQIASGRPTLQIDATDRGGGVQAVTVDVNGVRAASPSGDCPHLPSPGDYADSFRPCNDLHTAIQLNTEQTPWRDGQNTLRVCAYDVATDGSVPNQVCEQRTLFVDNSCADSSGAVGKADSISAGLENPRTGRLKRTHAVRSTDGAALKGQLSGTEGPVKAASVCVYETVDEPAGIEQLVQVAKTSSSGQFGVELPAGPSRMFRVAYRYGDSRLESPSMYLESSVLPAFALTKKELSNGQAVGFRGHLPGPGSSGRSVTMQARVGKKWRSFKQLQTDAHGDFKGKYRFTQTRGHVLYVFRALVKKQGGYPYDAGASKKRKLLVRG